MNVLRLIVNVPSVDDLDGMSDWFSDVLSWADKNGNSGLQLDAKTAMFFSNHPDRVEEYRRKLLSRLKTIRREMSFMDDKAKVFIVHGHDTALKETVARFLEKAGLEAVILSEQAGRSNTIIEKLERKTADVKFGIVLYTADDKQADGSFRARQNVVFEHGLLIGYLGRENTCAILEDGVEGLSDISGIEYLHKDNWMGKLLKELQASGLDVDVNAAMRMM